MLSRARDFLTAQDSIDLIRVDVPGRRSGEDISAAGMRASVQAVIPALQSGSLFGDRTGLLVVDAHLLQKVEAEVIAEVAAVADQDAVVAVFVAVGSIAAPLSKVLSRIGERVSIKKLNERDTAKWLDQAGRDRGIHVTSDAADVLLQRFGTDIASLSQALDQLMASGEAITGDLVRRRLKNRPDQPMWHYMDAIAAGDREAALRRLADFLEHGHPLVALATIQGDLRRRSLAAAAKDYETFVHWNGGRRNYGTEKVWRQRDRARGTDLKLALDAVARADIQLKTSPEATHRVMMERLTVALCRWYRGTTSERRFH